MFPNTRLSFGFFLSFCLLFVVCTGFSQTAMPVIDGGSEVAAFWNLARTLDVLSKNLEASKSPEAPGMIIAGQIDFLCQKLFRTSDPVVPVILDAVAKKIFVPTGGLWVSFGKAAGPRLALPAKINVSEFLPILTKLFPILSKFESPSPSQAVLKFGPESPLTIVVKETGIECGVASLGDIPEDWKDFVTQSNKPEAVFLCEIKTQGFQGIFDESEAQASATVALFRLLSRLRFGLFEDRVNAGISLENSAQKPKVKETLEILLQGFSEGLAKNDAVASASSEEVADLKSVVSRIKVVDQGPWIFLEVDNLSPKRVLGLGLVMFGSATGLMESFSHSILEKAKKIREMKLKNEGK